MFYPHFLFLLAVRFISRGHIFVVTIGSSVHCAISVRSNLFFFYTFVGEKCKVVITKHQSVRIP